MTKTLLTLGTVALLGNLLFLNSIRMDVNNLKENTTTTKLIHYKNNISSSNDFNQKAILNKLETMTQQIDRLINSEKLQTSNIKPQHKEVKTVQAESSGTPESQNEAVYFPSDIEETFALGFVDKTSGELMEDDLKNMSKEDNKKFWAEMFKKLENEEIVQIHN